MHLGRTNQQFNQTCWYVKITARDHHTNFNNLAQKGKISPVLSRNTLNIKNLKISFCVVRSSHGSMNKQSKKDWTVKKEKNWLTCDTLVLYLGKIKKIIAVFFHSKYLLAIYVGVAGRAVREKQHCPSEGSYFQGGVEFLACKNSILSSPLSAWDVSPGEKSEPQRQKFHTDDVKSVLNLVRSSDWSTW